MFFKLLGVEYWNLLYFHICLSLLDQKNNFLCISPTKITYQCVCFQQKWSVVTTGFYYQKKGWAVKMRTGPRSVVDSGSSLYCCCCCTYSRAMIAQVAWQLPLCSGWQRWILEKWHCYYLLVLASVNPLVGLWSVGQPWNVYNNIFSSLISILLIFSSFFQLWAHLSQMWCNGDSKCANRKNQLDALIR